MDASADVEMAVDDRKVGDPNPPEIKVPRGSLQLALGYPQQSWIVMGSHG